MQSVFYPNSWTTWDINTNLEYLRKTLRPIHRFNFNSADQLKVTADTNTAIIVYQYYLATQSNPDFAYNFNLHSRTPRLLDRQWFIF